MKYPGCAPDYDYLCIILSAVTGNLFLIIIIGTPLLLFFLFKNTFPDLYLGIANIIKSILAIVILIGIFLIFTHLVEIGFF